MSERAPKPGWYADVQIPGGERYWDGQQWTDQRRDGEGRVPVPVPASAFGKPKAGWGSNGYGLTGIVLYVMAGVLYANDEPELAAIFVAFAIGASLIAIIAVGVRLGHREWAEEQESRR